MADDKRTYLRLKVAGDWETMTTTVSIIDPNGNDLGQLGCVQGIDMHLAIGELPKATLTVLDVETEMVFDAVLASRTEGEPLREWLEKQHEEAPEECPAPA